MNGQARKQLLGKIHEVGKGLCRLESEADLFPPHCHKSGDRFLHDSVPMQMALDATKLHREIVKSLFQQQGWSDKFSERFIDHELRTIYVKFVEPSSRQSLESGFNALIESYASYCVRNSCLIPLGGILLEQDTFEIGRVVLHKGTRDFLKSRLPDYAGAEFITARNSCVDRALKGEEEIAYAEFSANAERQRTEEMAFDECGRVLDLLRFAIPQVTLPHLNIGIGYQDEFIADGSMTTFINSADGRLNPTHHHRMSGHSKFLINQKCIRDMDKLGIPKFSEMLKKSVAELTEFEEILLRALHWYSTGRKTRERENAFLNYVTVLETFFTPRDRDPISNAIAEGCAFVLCDGVANRKSFFRRIKNLYTARCGLSHGGKSGILESELGEIEWIAWELLNWMLTRNEQFTTHESLRNWLEEQRFR